MAIRFIITSYTESDRMAEIFGQLLFTGNYATGGDTVTATVLDIGTAGVSGTTRNSAGMPVFLQGQTGLHATRPPQRWNVAIESGYNPVLVPGVAALDFKIKLFDPSTKAELAAGAYPGSVTGAVFNTLDLQYKKNV